MLEPFTYEGNAYLLDRRTSAVYLDGGGDDQYPELVGKLGQVGVGLGAPGEGGREGDGGCGWGW